MVASRSLSVVVMNVVETAAGKGEAVSCEQFRSINRAMYDRSQQAILDRFELALLEAQRLVGEAGIRGKALFGKIGIFHDFVIDKILRCFWLGV